MTAQSIGGATSTQPITYAIEEISRLPAREILERRRRVIQDALDPDQAAVICAGLPQARNFPANHYPDYRASSHFLYLTGQHLAGAVLLVTHTDSTLYQRPPTKSGALWHGAEKSFGDLSAELGCQVSALDQLPRDLTRFRDVLSLPMYQDNTAAQLRDLIGSNVDRHDHVLVEAMVQARLIHDQEAIDQLRIAAHLTKLAHSASVEATPNARWAHQLRAAAEAPLTARGARLAYAPIITPHGEVLHNHNYHTLLRAGDLILADIGAETPSGWAGDVTRTWPVSGRWSDTQRAIYEIILEALRASTAIARPGVEYAALHQASHEVIAQGLIDVGILKGSLSDVLAANSVSLFFPHGIGHLLGLDVHDMEDLGDHAGYAHGRHRRETFGWSYLRLDRVLRPGMAVTVEPGFYQVPELLSDPKWAGERAGDYVNWEVLSHFSDVRGIRIEDDLLITSSGVEVLSHEIPKSINELSFQVD